MSDRDSAIDKFSLPPVLDVEGTLVRFGGDRELFVEMAGYLLEDAPRVFSELSAAVAENDAAAIRMSAHALKGLVAGCGGVRTARAAQALEDAGQAFDLSQTGAQLKAVKTELDELMRALEAHRR